MQKKILFLVNHDVVIYNFRLEMVEEFINRGHEVHISSPYGERIEDLIQLGAIFHEIEMERHGMNPKEEWRLLKAYKVLFEDIRPDICLGFTIKPNIYGAIAAKRMGIPFVANITGLGTAVETPGIQQQVFILLYKYAFKNVQRVFYQNRENQEFFIKHNIAAERGALLPGSGVNLERYSYKKYPADGTIKFAFVSRIMKEKGIEQFLDAALAIKKDYTNVEFHVCGFCESEYGGRLLEENQQGNVIYHGMIRDVAKFMEQMHCIIHPTYYPEGISNVLLEACATGRPIITTNRSGCRGVVEDGKNGYMIPCKNSVALIDAIKRFIGRTWNEKEEMGLNARKTVEKHFDRRIVIEQYLKEIEGLESERE